MSEPKPSDLTPEQLASDLKRRVFELNLHMRALSLYGYRVHADVVDRSNPAQPDGWPEFQVQTRGPEE